jgi:hypothetical protein
MSRDDDRIIAMDDAVHHKPVKPGGHQRRKANPRWHGAALPVIATPDQQPISAKVSQSPVWTPITPLTGSLFHADPHSR